MIGTLNPSLDAMTYADADADTDGLRSAVSALASRAAEAEGVVVDWIELRRRGGSFVLRVYIDREGSGPGQPESGVTLDDCERVSRRLGLLLDVDDPIESSYTLEVSTPGLDRPLRREHDYVRFVGRLAKIQTKEPVSGRRRFKGRLKGVRDGEVALEAEGGEALFIPLSTIDKARLEVEFPSSREGTR